MSTVSFDIEILRGLLRHGGYLDHMIDCAVRRVGDTLYFDKSSRCYKDARRFRWKTRCPRHMLPGTWFTHLFALTGIKPCPKCVVRKKMMDTVGWWGLWRLVALKTFWVGGVKGGCGCGNKGNG